MSSIIILDDKTINKIAAGEVIERPASIVKELVENAIDANADEINISIEDGGKNLITVTDNGYGIAKNDLNIAFIKHATSKLKNGNLEDIKYLGFRGEALPSISAVSKITLNSKEKNQNKAWSIKYEGGELLYNTQPSSLHCGTTIEVRDLFFTTPTKLKFLASEKTENAAITEIINKLALANFHISFSLNINQKKILKYNKNNCLLNRIYEINCFNQEFKNNAIEIDTENNNFRLHGFISKPSLHHSRSNLIYIIVNNRPINDNLILGAIRYAYSDFIIKDKYPIAILNYTIPCSKVDVNVHPNKSEVRFQDKKLIYNITVKAIKNAIKEYPLHHTNCTSFAFENINFFDNQNNIVRNTENVTDYINSARESNDTNHSFNNFYNYVSTSPLKQNDKDKNLSINKISFKNNIEQQNNLLPDYPLGIAKCQIYKKYIISQTDDYVVFTDQHAAHERLTYEYIKNVEKESIIKRQLLLVPEVVELQNEYEQELLIEYKEKLLLLGLLIEKLGNISILVREIPAILKNIDIKPLIHNLITSIATSGDTMFLNNKIKETCSSIACHSSIRAGRILKIEEMNSLLRLIELTPHSTQCNHGRPTYIKLTLNDLDKMFNRT